ncbi:MAG TPA: hypothetical protein VK658_20555 [Chryseolinea sp.]|nr:hypothetical protein [Chryseolinea sp.]
MLFAPRFFGYEEEIRRKLADLGAKVDFHDQRPSNSVATKALIRINKRFLATKINRYYTQIIDNSKGVFYDYVLFISPEAITKDSLLKMKATHPRSRFILYMWDSFENKRKNIDDLMQLFDDRFSFDNRDCQLSHGKLTYRPLFFLNEYAAIRDDVSREFELLFIGTIHSDRHRILGKFRSFCLTHDLSYFYYMFMPSKILYYYRSLKDSSLRKAGPDEFKYHPLTKAQVLALMEQSNVILDIEHPNQSGLTMRTIETLGARRKLITTNERVTDYDFFHPQNILVIDRDNIQIDPAFFKTPVVLLDSSIYKKYSIDGWISDVFRIHRQ